MQCTEKRNLEGEVAFKRRGCKLMITNIPRHAEPSLGPQWTWVEDYLGFCSVAAFFFPKNIFKWKVLEIEKCVLSFARNQQKDNRTCQSEVAFLPAHWNVSPALCLGIRLLSGSVHPCWGALKRFVGQAAWVRTQLYHSLAVRANVLISLSFFIHKMGITVLPWGSIKRVEKDNPNNTLSQWFSKSVCQNHWQGGEGVLLKSPRRLSPTPRVSDSVALGWGEIIWISNKFPDDTVMLVQGPHFENHCFLHSSRHVVECSKMLALVNFNSVFEPV